MAFCGLFAAQQQADKLADESPSTPWWIRFIDVLGGSHSTRWPVDGYSIQGRLKRDEKDARFRACAAAVVGTFCRPIRVCPGFEDDFLLTLIGDMKFSGNQDHPLR